MKYLFGLSTFILLTFIPLGMDAQSPVSTPDETYGLDPLLHNGSFYNYHVPFDTEGTPFFSGPDYVDGSVRIRGVSYPHLLLKYDVVNQVLLFQYQNATGGAQHIVLSDAWLESFDLGATHFELFVSQDTLKQIYQVIGQGSTRVFYGWSKERELDTHTGSSHFMFSKLKKKTYLFSNGKLQAYKNNKTWTSLFDPGVQSLIKKYLAERHINVKTASDQVMAALITYCNSL